MNERIRELELQAADGTVDPNGPFTAEEFNNFTKKFAELIVEECVAQCWTVSAIEHKGYVISECSKRMRKHFGVES